MSGYRKKLIEVALPLEAINKASAREKSIRHGHPSTLHLWWARRPLAACRAVLFAQLVDDPSGWPDRFPAEEAQDKERQRIFRIIEDLVVWENSTNETVLNAARKEIAQSLARNRVEDEEAEALDHEVLAPDVAPKLVNKYLAEVAPPVHDPFAGGGSIPLEAQRLGLRAIATDLNPVAVMINKALIEIPPNFAGRPPIGSEPKAKKQKRLGARKWKGAEGLAEDVRRYGEWMREEAYERIGHFYPDVEVTAEIAAGRADLTPLVGKKLKVIAWLWARTVQSPNPAFKGVHVPLVRSFLLATKKGKEAWVETVFSPDRKSYEFTIKTGSGAPTVDGTVNRQGAECLASGEPIPFSYVRHEAKEGRMGSRLMAIVAEGSRRRIYLPPSEEAEAIANSASPEGVPDTDLPEKALGFRVQEYGMRKHRELFTARQLLLLSTLSEIVAEARNKVMTQAQASGWSDDGKRLEDGGTGATAYAEAIAAYLGIGVSRYANPSSTICTWNPGKSKEDIRYTFSRQAIPMTWDYAEGNPFSGSSGNLSDNFEKWMFKTIRLLPATIAGVAQQHDVMFASSSRAAISTDPPYYDNIGYADLSDYFYVWMRQSLHQLFPALFSTMLVPKARELVATPFRHGGRDNAEHFFLEGMTQAIRGIADESPDHIPLAIYYAFKQSEIRDAGVSSTGWETFLEALFDAGLAVNGTWPVRTERDARSVSIGTNALASSVVLACRKRAPGASAVTRGDFRRLLKSELPQAMHHLQKGSVAPVDMAQAAIGPGMAIFSRHLRVVEADGSRMTVRSALQLINAVIDEIRGEEEAAVDADTRFAITWYEGHKYADGPFGDADNLARARNVSVSGVEEAGIVKSAAGKVRILKRDELPADWDPATDNRLTVWEATQHLIKRLEVGGEQEAAILLGKLGPMADQARDLAYRLYSTCERKGWADEARAYNGLVIAWPELEKLANNSTTTTAPGGQTGLFDD